jgi:hypothetical protein
MSSVFSSFPGKRSTNASRIFEPASFVERNDMCKSSYKKPPPSIVLPPIDAHIMEIQPDKPKKKVLPPQSVESSIVWDIGTPSRFVHPLPALHKRSKKYGEWSPNSRINRNFLRQNNTLFVIGTNSPKYAIQNAIHDTTPATLHLDTSAIQYGYTNIISPKPVIISSADETTNNGSSFTFMTSAEEEQTSEEEKQEVSIHKTQIEQLDDNQSAKDSDKEESENNLDELEQIENDEFEEDERNEEERIPDDPTTDEIEEEDEVQEDPAEEEQEEEEEEPYTPTPMDIHFHTKMSLFFGSRECQVTPLATDCEIQTLLEFDSVQLLYLMITSMQDQNTKEILPFVSDPDVPYIRHLEVSCAERVNFETKYEILVEDLRKTEVSDLTADELLLIRSRFEQLDLDGSGDISEKEVISYYNHQFEDSISKFKSIRDKKLKILQKEDDIQEVIQKFEDHKDHMRKFFDAKLLMTMVCTLKLTTNNCTET